MTDILQQAYEFTNLSGQAPTPELAMIRYIFITPHFLEQIDDSALFLSFIENMVKERLNVSFPDDYELCQTYLNDCITLKNKMMQKEQLFNEKRWLAYTIQLFENIKTPYYSCYFACLSEIVVNITDERRADTLLGTFYSLIIKSQQEALDIIEQIARTTGAFADIPELSETLLCEILEENLMLLAQEKSFWIHDMAELLFSDEKEMDWQELSREKFSAFFLKKELEFSKMPQAYEAKSISEYLAHRTAWMAEQRIDEKERSLLIKEATQKRQFVDSEFLNTYAYNMNESVYVTNPAIGREKEIEELELILASPKKSPIILGEAGVGKTSIVEGLAWRLTRGEIPAILKNKKICKLTTSALLSDTKYVGEMEARMKLLTGELKKHPEVILFIDEIHTIVGAGSTENSNNDIANMLKPYIDRGEMKLIGATTREEYEQFIAKDKALSRRFYPIYVEEADETMTLQILEESIPAIEQETKVKNHFNIEETREILTKLIQISDTVHQIPELALHRPELPLTLLEMAFSYAAIEGKEAVKKSHFHKAVLHSSRLKKEDKEQFTL